VVACVRLAIRNKLSHEVRRFATTTRGLLELADWLEASGVTQVAMEATGVYWKPVWHMLEERFQLVLANAAHVHNVPGRKSDVNDATWIADLMAHGLIRASFVPPAPIQELRDLTRTRKQLGREIVQHTQRIQKVLEDANIKLSSLITEVLGASGRRILKALIAGESDAGALAALGGPRLKCSRARGLRLRVCHRRSACGLLRREAGRPREHLTRPHTPRIAFGAQDLLQEVSIAGVLPLRSRLCDRAVDVRQSGQSQLGG
jgi:transposase